MFIVGPRFQFFHVILIIIVLCARVGLARVELADAYCRKGDYKNAINYCASGTAQLKQFLGMLFTLTIDDCCALHV